MHVYILVYEQFTNLLIFHNIYYQTFYIRSFHILFQRSLMLRFFVLSALKYLVATITFPQMRMRKSGYVHTIHTYIRRADHPWIRLNDNPCLY